MTSFPFVSHTQCFPDVVSQIHGSAADPERVFCGKTQPRKCQPTKTEHGQIKMIFISSQAFEMQNQTKKLKKLEPPSNY